MPPWFHYIERLATSGTEKKEKGSGCANFNQRNMAAGAADGLFRSLYEGCISGSDIGIERRPYHRNCRCALHDKSRGNCPHAFHKSKNVSYPMRRAWSEGCLAMAAVSSHSSPSSSPALAPGLHGKQQLGACKEENEDDLPIAKA